MAPNLRSDDDELPVLDEAPPGIDQLMVPGSVAAITITLIYFLGDWAEAESRLKVWLYFAIAWAAIGSLGWRYFVAKKVPKRNAYTDSLVAVVLFVGILGSYGIATLKDSQLAGQAKAKQAAERATEEQEQAAEAKEEAATRDAQRRADEDRRRGVLLPADLPAPPLPKNVSPSDIPANALTVFFGNHSVTWGTGDAFVAMRHSETVDLIVRRVGDGITLDTCFYDRNGAQIGKMYNGEFAFTNDDDLLTVHRPEDHVLIVRDRSNAEVLDVRFLNKKTLQIKADFRTVHGAHIQIDDDRFVINSENIENFSLSGLATTGASLAFTKEGFPEIRPIPIDINATSGSCR